MADRKKQPVNAITSVLLLCIIFSSQADADLLDPTLIARELQIFARDALGVDEMQVGSLQGTAKSVSMSVSCKKLRRFFNTTRSE